MADDDDRLWRELLRGLRDGDPEITTAFYRRYGPMLEHIAAQQLQTGLLRRISPETVAHSACRTFLRRMQDGQFELEGTDRLWNLLVAITLTKARRQARFHLAQRRAVQREVHEAPVEDDDSPAAAIPSAAPTPAEQAAFADQLEQLLGRMTEQERLIVQLRLEQASNQEIAAQLGITARSVRRILHRLQAHLTEALLAEDA
jgi:RNA polymerase sigma factor (sigma-70 family)